MGAKGLGGPGRHGLWSYAAPLTLVAVLAGVVVARVLLPAQRPLPPERETRTTVAAGSGVSGTVTVREGDCQPGVVGEAHRTGCGARPVSRRIYVYSPPIGAAAIASAYYRGGLRPVSVGRSDGRGNYAIELPAGSYSVLVEDGGRHYCNSLAGGRACAVTVRPGKRARHDLEIDHGSF
jgi:hypothetical protein